MFRKRKQTQTSSRERQVPRRSSAPVFSYHSKRNPSQLNMGATRRRPSSQQQKSQRSRLGGVTKRQVFSYAPSLVAIMALLGCSIYVTTLSPVPRVQMSDAGGYASTKQYEKGIQALLSESVLNKSKLLIDTKQLEERIRDDYPELGDVSITIPLAGRRLIVNATPTQPALLLAGSGETLVIDGGGRAILAAREAPSSMKDNVPVLQDQTGIELSAGSYVLPASAVAFVEAIHYQLTSANLGALTYVLPAVPNELHVSLEGEGYYIKFDMTGEGDVQAGSFKALRDYLTDRSIQPRQYIDVRVPGRAFYK